MQFFSKYKCRAILVGSLFINTSVYAVVDEFTCYDLASSESAVTNIPLGDTVTCGSGASGIDGVVNNYGELQFNLSSIIFLRGGINNYGLIKNGYDFIALDGSKYINHKNAILNSTEWLRFNRGASLDNFGTINFIPNTGDGSRDNLFGLNGTFNNYNVCRIDDPNIRVSGTGEFINQGTFEISSQTTYSTNISYTQNSGETVVNGAFEADNIQINAGAIRGNGIVTANNTLMLGRGAGFSPGSIASSLDTLTINVDGGMLISVFNYVNIELGSVGHDKLHVNGDLYLFGTINVTLQGLPAQSYEIISSDSPIVFGQNLKINLPSIFNWDIEYTDTSIIIHKI